jgi:hypothetical protein
MADAPKGSSEWNRLRNVRFRVKPRVRRYGRGWLCGHMNHSFAPTAGFGLTVESAYVDYVEECELLYGKGEVK